jgi:hypothetical protein
VEAAELKFGPYLLAVPGTTVTLNLPPNLPSPPAVLDMDIRIQTSGGTLRISELELLPESFLIRIVADPGSLAAASADASKYAYDDTGHSYKPLSEGIAFGKDEFGGAFFRKTTIELDAPLDPAARALSIDFSEFAKVESGPWNFQISIAGE